MEEDGTGAYDLETQRKENTTLYAKWEAEEYSVSYQIGGETYTPDISYQSYTYGVGLTLPQPAREGYTFDGWYLQSDYSDGERQTAIGAEETGTRTFYGRWIDVTDPSLSVELTREGSAADDGTVWHNAQTEPEIRLNYSDNEGVTALYVKVDDGDFEEISGAGTGSGTPQDTEYEYADLQEGRHTYTFRAEDAAENWKEQSVTVNLDTTAPVIGEITYEYKAADFLDWIIGKESLVITIPVEEYGSGAETIDYTLQQDGGEEQKLSAELADTDGGREAVLTFEADWKGTVTDITCTDTAGNVSAVKSLSSTGGIIVEDNAPEISFEAVTEGADLSGWLPDKETVSVEVADTREETGDGISSGIAEVTWSLDGGDAVSVSDQGFDSSLEDSCDFTVEITGRGEHTLNVTAVDHAGNTNTQSIKVKISEKRETPDAGIDYREETLTGLEPGGSYTIKSSVAAGETVTASDDGTVDIKEQWMGQGLVIVRQGNGTDYRDSEEQYLPVDKRPDAPEGLEGTSVSYQSEDGTITNVTAAMEYRKYEETSWIQITEDMLTEGSLTGLAAGTYLVRFQATDSSFVSPTKSVVVPEYTLVEIGGSIAVSGGLKYGETLTADISGMTPGEATIRYEWKRSGSADVLGTEQTYLLTADDIGHTITLTVYGTEAYTGELSAETARVEKADGAEISGAGSTDETIRNRTDGTITGITTAMEYKLSTEDAYIAVTEQMLTEGALTGLAPGSYDVRCQETEVSKPGPVKTFVIREGRTLTVSFESNGGSAVENETGMSWHNRVAEPAEPVREGYRFDGWYEDSALQDAWDFSRDEVEDDLTLYAGWTYIASPSLSVELTREGGEADDGTVWHNAQTEPEIRLTYSDNEGVAALYVKVDEGEYSEIAEAGTGDGTTVDTEYEYTDLQEGKHTYTFRTEDAEGNRTEQSVAVNLDTAAPVIGEITCEYKEEVSGWIVGEERLVIRIPVEENGSGADAVTCTVREDGGEGQTVTVRLEDNGDGQAAELTFEADWKGTVTDITCTDTAGNVSDAKNLSSTGGIIVEDNAPEICFRAATEGADLTQWLPDQETVIVEVADAGTEASPAVSSGIAEVTWSLDGEEAVPVSQGRADGLTESCDFTVEISDRGEHLLSVTAVDHTGNTNTQQITVRISEQWEMPQAVIDYRAETLTGLAPEGSYTIESNALESGTVTASADGTADIPERWMGQELVIIRNGNGADRRDSGAQILTVDARPDAPEGLEGTAVSYQSEDGTISGVTSAMEYRRSGDETWIPVTEDMLAGDVLEGLAAGMYEVRYQATETAFASPCSEISVPEYVPVEISGILRISGKMISGETLAADLSGVLPADADVRYEWRRSGSDEILGTESSYRLTADDIGHTISLTVYGIEAYTGQLSAAADGTVEAARAADTGDGAGVTAWLLLLIVSGAAAAGFGALGYRNKKRR